MNTQANIGMIGVGLMGHGIAKNLLQNGFSLTYLDHPGNQPVTDLRELGAVAAETCAQVAATSEVVLICVTGSEQAELVITGPEGVAAGLRPGTVVIDCSTIEPHVTPRLARVVNEQGGEYLDAPLTRTPKEAEAGRLNTMVGGDAVTVDRLRPVFDAYCENVYHAGPVTSGHTLKLLHNFVSLSNCLLLAEAAVCAQRCDIAPDVLIEVLTSGGGDSTALKRLTPYLQNKDSSSFRFSLANSRKDLGYYHAFVEHIDSAREMAAAAAATLNNLVSASDAARPLPELVDLMGAATGKQK